jgi:hypothetical protein
LPKTDKDSGAKIQEAADGALALVESDANNLNQQLTKVSDAVSQFAHKGKVAVEVRIRDARDVSFVDRSPTHSSSCLAPLD